VDARECLSMPFEYRPFVNPYIGSMSNLMGRGVEARSRAELSAAEAQAGAAGRLGDITGAQWSGLGDTLAGGIDAYVTEQREAPLREHALWQMEQDKVAAERATVTAAREDVEAERADVTYDLQQEEREYGKRYDKIINDGELAMGADPQNKEAHRAAVREALAQAGLPASYSNDYDELLRAADIHESALLTDQARREAAEEQGASAVAIREHTEKRQGHFEKIQSTRAEFGDNSPENRAARNDFFLFTGEPDPVLGREHDVELANIQASGRSLRPEIASAIDNYTGAIRDFVQTGNRAPMHQAEQHLWSLGQNPGNVRANIVEGLDKEQREIYKGLNPVVMGERRGTPPESLFPILPGVSPPGTLFTPSVAPGAPQQPGPWATPEELQQFDATPNVITENGIREEVELMRVKQEEEGVPVDYTLEDGVLQALGANQTIVQEDGSESDWPQKALVAQQAGGRSAAIGAPPPGTPPQRMGQPGDVPRGRPRRRFFPPATPFTGPTQISPVGQGGLRRGAPPVDLSRRR
jgi:hypothetical protein